MRLLNSKFHSQFMFIIHTYIYGAWTRGWGNFFKALLNAFFLALLLILKSSNIMEAPFSPIMIHAAFVLAPTNFGITEASITLSPSIP